ncbi:transmembrane protein 169 [Biomphalaria glabrata]|nr:transmembrane protein 169-like [Biomphalaria glabrata]
MPEANTSTKGMQIVELQEQSEPLMPANPLPGVAGNTGKRKVSINEKCLESNDPAPESSTGAINLAKPVTSQTPSPSHTNELLAGGMPKNRKRPGSTSDGQRVTMIGTVTRGNGVGQPVEVQIELTENEFMRLTSREKELKKGRKRECNQKEGLHIVLWGVLCMPVALVLSLCMSFYNGAMTWYNLIIFFSEEKSIAYRVTVSPLIILSFPLTVGLSSLCIAVIASVLQISWSWLRWQTEILDGEKGFYGWFCSKVGLPKCSPYEVVVLDETNS